MGGVVDGNGAGRDAAGKQLRVSIMTLGWTRLGYLPASQHAPEAQLDRASASGADGPAFESRLAHRCRGLVVSGKGDGTPRPKAAGRTRRPGLREIGRASCRERV